MSALKNYCCKRELIEVDIANSWREIVVITTIQTRPPTKVINNKSFEGFLVFSPNPAFLHPNVATSLFGTSQEKCRVMNANASDINIIIFFKRRSNTMLTTRKLTRKHRERFYSQCPLLDGQFPLGDFLFPSLRVSNHSSDQVLRAFPSCQRCFFSSSPSRCCRK